MQSNRASEASLSETNLPETSLTGISLPEGEPSEVGLSEAELVQVELAQVELAQVELAEISISEPERSHLKQATPQQATSQSSAALLGIQSGRLPGVQQAGLSPALLASPAERAAQGGHIFFKAEKGVLYLYLPSNQTAVEWSVIWEQLQHRLEASQRIWPPQTPVYLVANDRLLDQRQLDQLAVALSNAHLILRRVLTSRRQTAIAAVTSGYSVDQQLPTLGLPAIASPAASRVAALTSPELVLAEPLYLETTLRSGGEVRHPGSVVVVGDTNPGSAIIADGDILVWGRLRGVAHAGAQGDRDRQIMALQMEPTQLRIADQVARAPAKPPNQVYPEVAYTTPEGIQIMRAADFAKQYSKQSGK
ncbi:MAG: septum site-determining protein MinC [Thermosynechococcaceae cyanobacterium MS004]|nr:septum site-determining protein MinC [Thermosynechococcaceae cyanobacterium MS004]